MEVKQMMTANAEWVDADTPLPTVAKMLRDKNIGCLPVGENDRLVGMITDRDIACRAVAGEFDTNSCKASDVMSKGITYCFDDQTDAEALELMEDKQIHHLPVLNRQKRIVGMLSMSDFALRSRQNLSSEIVHLASRDASRNASRPH